MKRRFSQIIFYAWVVLELVFQKPINYFNTSFACSAMKHIVSSPTYDISLEDVYNMIEFGISSYDNIINLWIL